MKIVKPKDFYLFVSDFMKFFKIKADFLLRTRLKIVRKQLNKHNFCTLALVSSFKE